MKIRGAFLFVRAVGFTLVFLHLSYFVKNLGKGWSSAIGKPCVDATMRAERKWRYEQSAGQILYQSGQRHRAAV